MVLMLGIMGTNTACDKLNFLHKEKKEVTATKKKHHKKAVKHAAVARKTSQKAKDKNVIFKNINEVDKTKATNIVKPKDVSHHFGSIRTGRELNIAMIIPLSGQDARVGQSMLDAAQLASAELGTGRINIVIVDSGSTPESASKALANLNTKVDVIVGPVLESQMAAVHRYSRAKDIANITFVNDKDLVNMGNLLMFGMPIEQQMSRALSYAIQKGVKNIYTVLPNNSMGTSIESLLLEYKKSGDIKDFVIARYNSNVTSSKIDFRPIVDELKNKVTIIPDYSEGAVLLLPQYGRELRKISQQFAMLQDTNFKLIKVICGSQFHDSGPYAITWSPEPWFADVETSARTAFSSRFQTTNKYVPDNMASLAYDAVALILAVVEQNKDNLLVFDPKTLLNKTGFEGINGVFRFDDDGSGERLLSMFKISSNQMVEIDQALPSFD